ncbi:hypothetical protein DBR11_28695 [Pedobacter sp. HMWF019]|uniref:cysteine peptidase family C39 domain-containing protein n=1 Tax=Pedobacter sp. HMWF019 TaxID=2056856 RepID=UPI000D394979|nr:cysteine peptidase family C39 domain-containing protein [Pedobacter sp. HMWF019]PTS91598.1 hypothetical protein DBR11_28695 [Pedobacter sp. HMWF019]
MLLPLKSIPNAVSVLSLLIKTLKIPVTSYTIKNDLLEHPDYPSMLALSDCLTSWNIPNKAFQVEKESFNLAEFPVPFVAHLKREDNEFVVVDKIEGDNVIFSNEKENRKLLVKQEFLKLWDGVILYAEKDLLSGEAKYTESLVKEWLIKMRIPFIILMTLCGITYILSQQQITAFYLSIIILKLSGISVSCLLLMHGINNNNPFIANLCALGKKNDCNAILKSDAAKVTSWLTWSEVGMFYFAGSFLCLLLNPSTKEWLSWLNIICLPYSFYSFWYQAKVKNWCILCCSIQVLLWLEAAVFYLGGNSFDFQISNFSIYTFVGAFLCFLTPIAIWSFIKPFLQEAEHLQPLKQQLKRFKYNSDLFNQILSNQTNYKVPDDIMPIVLGNRDAKTVVTMVTNPFCGPCAAVHKSLSEWIDQRDDIQLKVVFATADSDDDYRTKVARHATSLSLLDDKRVVGQALDDWYEQSDKDYLKWSTKYPVPNVSEMETVTRLQKRWCEMLGVTFTPTILINGYKLIEPYTLEDIKYLIE